MTRHLPLVLLPFFFFLLLPPAISSGRGGVPGDTGASSRGHCCDVDADGPASREFFPMEGDIAWVVQVSDLHLSAYHHDRARDLEALLAPALRIVRPALLIITGDLTDAKNKERTSTRQDEFEWVQYRNSMDAVVRKSGMDRRRLFDIRGNHDKYGVPCPGDKLDFFSIYSMSAQLNRTSTIQSISLVGNQWKYMFLGIDDTMITGLRGPSNLFGHPTDKRIKTLEFELQYWDADPAATTTKIVFGHFPMSFIASSEGGKRYESAFAARSVSAYLCGHLHAKFSNKLWRPHTIEGIFDLEQRTKRRFWEWELGDWKESRLMRIITVDQGDVSFLDIALNKHGLQDDFQTTILITYPIDSRSMAQIRPDHWVERNDINVLVFSVHSICNVTAKVYDSSRSYKAVEEIPLQLSTNSFTSQTLFSAKWNAENYRSPSATRYWLQVFVLDVHGQETSSTLRPFSVEGKSAYLPTTWLSYLVFYVQWEKLYSVLLWSNMSFLTTLLLLPKLLNHFMQSNGSYQRWAMSVSISSITGRQRLYFWPVWFLIEGSRNWILWCSMVLYLTYLLCLPWFWGHGASVNGDLAKMSILGWTMELPGCPIRKEKLGTPDIMAITLPFMYLVVTPLFLLIYSLFAERSTSCLHCSGQAIKSKESVSLRQEMEENRKVATGCGSKFIEDEMAFRTCKIRRWTRMTILLACFVSTFVHIKQFLAIGRAYGFGPVALSAALSLSPPFFFVAAVYLSH